MLKYLGPDSPLCFMRQNLLISFIMMIRDQWRIQDFPDRAKTYYYRPQTKFAKIMFLHLSVSHSVHRGVPAPLHAGIHPQAGAPPLQVHSPGSTPPGQVHPPAVHPRTGTPPSRYTPIGRYTPAQCMLRYGQQAGGTHPNGMQSCLATFLPKTTRK